MKTTFASLCVLALAAPLFGGPLDTAWLKGSTDKDPLTYACGEKMVFTLTPQRVGEGLPAGAYFVDWKRTGDDGLVATGRLAFAELPFVYETSIAKPGFVRLEAYVVDKDGKRYRQVFQGDTTTPEGKRAMNEFERRPHYVFFDGGAGADVATLRTIEPPADLADYWRTFDERLKANPMRVERVLVSTDADGYSTYAVSVSCAGVFPVTGYLTVPPAKNGERYPARLETHGYGGAVYPHLPPPRHYRNGEIVFNINAFGIRLPALGGTEADRKALWWAVHDGKATGHAFSVDQNQDRNTAFFNGMVLRVKRALQYLKSLPEWNGQDLLASGGSQGGLQTMWAAACGEGVTRAESGITWCCDMYTSGKLRKDPALKMSSDGWYIAWTPALAYYDAAIVATLVPKTCRVVVTRAGLGDYCCPPMGLAKLYNAMTCPKEIYWVQGSQHGYVPPVKEEIVQKAE